MDIQVAATIIGPDLTLQIKQIVQNHYSRDLNHYYETTINCSLLPNYTTLTLCNMLEHSKYALGVVVPAGS